MCLNAGKSVKLIAACANVAHCFTLRAGLGVQFSPVLFPSHHNTALVRRQTCIQSQPLNFSPIGCGEACVNKIGKENMRISTSSFLKTYRVDVAVAALLPRTVSDSWE